MIIRINIKVPPVFLSTYFNFSVVIVFSCHSFPYLMYWWFYLISPFYLVLINFRSSLFWIFKKTNVLICNIKSNRNANGIDNNGNCEVRPTEYIFYLSQKNKQLPQYTRVGFTIHKNMKNNIIEMHSLSKPR